MSSRTSSKAGDSDADEGANAAAEDHDIDIQSIPPKPKRSMTAYHIYSQLERNFIIQNHENYIPVPPIPGSIDENASERPPKYRNVVMPKNWFVSGKGEVKKKDRINHGVISFVELSKTISHNWNHEADHETKIYCRQMADRQLAQYREEMAAYVKKYGEEAVKIQSKKRKHAKRKSEELLGADENVSGEDGVYHGEANAKIQVQEPDASESDLKMAAVANDTGATASQPFQPDSSFSWGVRSAPNFEASLQQPQQRPREEFIDDAPPDFDTFVARHDEDEMVLAPDQDPGSIDEELYAHAIDQDSNVQLPMPPLQHQHHRIQNNHNQNQRGPEENNNGNNNNNAYYPLDREVSEFLSRMLNEHHSTEGGEDGSSDTVGLGSINFNTPRSLPSAASASAAASATSSATVTFAAASSASSSRNESTSYNSETPTDTLLDSRLRQQDFPPSDSGSNRG